MLGQRIARQVKAEDFLLFGQAVAFIPLGQVGQVGRAGFGLVVFIAAEEPICPLRRSEAADGAGLQGPIDGRKELRRLAPSVWNAPALISDSMAVRLTVLGSSRSQKSKRLR